MKCRILQYFIWVFIAGFIVCKSTHAGFSSIQRVNTVQSIYNAMLGVHRNGSCLNVIKGHFYKGIIEKLPFHGHFHVTPL